MRARGRGRGCVSVVFFFQAEDGIRDLTVTGVQTCALTYSDDLILLEVTFISGRPKKKRLGLLKALNDGVVSAAGISPDDLLITLYETPGENISFGRGLAQRAHVSDRTSRAGVR